MTQDNVHIDQQRFLLKLARDAIAFHLKTGKTLETTCPDGPLGENRGAFVTLKKAGQLQGCIGYPMPEAPLCRTIIEVSLMAAFQDHRFPVLKAGELKDIRIEISVLSLPRKISDPSQVEVGRHGIIISRGFNRGLLLPQVPLEWGWDRETYLRHGCLKAGLDEGAWAEPNTQIEVFTAQVFSDPAD
jgi:AmmeMemoRadiSam system protein A